MEKRKYLLLIVLMSFSVKAEVSAKWLSVASILIEDGESRILFDPDWTRPTLLQYLGLKKLKSDPVLVKEELSKLGLSKLDGIFTSHSHFDHAIDAPMVAGLTGAINYVDTSSKRISDAYQDSSIKTKMVAENVPLEIGKFKITPIKKEHAKIEIIKSHFLPGEVPDSFDFNFWDYRTGDTWFYLIEHPERVILVDQGNSSHLKLLPAHLKKIDVLIQGISNRKSDEDFMSGYIEHFAPSVFIPLHFDNFFFSFTSKESLLPGIKLDSLLEKIQKKLPTSKVIIPRYGETVSL